MNNKALSIVRSPFQLICLNEYLLENSNNIKCLIIVNTEKEKDQCLQILKYLKLLDYSIFIAKPFYVQINLSKLISKKYEELVIGHYFDNICVFAARILRYKKLVVLDDGVSTLAINKLKSKTSPYGRIYFKQKFFNFFFHSPKNFIFFTIFFDHIASSNLYVKSKNNLTFLSDQVSPNFDKNCVYFIGDPVVEEKLISLDDYLVFLERLSNKSKLIYFPHRNESEANLTRYRNIGVEIRSLNVSFEIYLVQNNVIPNKLISFHSTALFTSRLILNKFIDRIKFYYIELDQNSEKVKENHHLIYIQDFFKTSGFKKITFYD
jgi:hypothetical protein